MRFWFDDVGKDRWFAKDNRLDLEIARRFGDLRKEVLASKAAGWRDSIETLTAAILLTDQFSRNIFRGSAKAFEADPLALELAFEALDRGWSHSAPEAWRAFLLMPLMHSEDPDVQTRCVEEFQRLGDPLNLEFALQHRDQIDRFGRFPGRNKALGRVSTMEEREALEAGAAF
ncbi:DUF924 domain-containing protein [Sphingomonas sp. HDW15A]|nr:DUF924 domain-containing protein [Sphingomonas sp. HDW15A]